MRRPFWPILTLLAIGGAFSTQVAADGDPGEARVVAAWPAGPFEARISLDRPIGAEVARGLVGRSIAFDESRPTIHSRAAPKAEASGSLRIAAARLDDDGRTLVLTTDPHPRAGTYTLDLPLGGSGPPVKVAYDLTGVDAAWAPDDKDAGAAWKLWWPALSPSAVLKELGRSVEHERTLPRLVKHGKLTLDTIVVLPRDTTTLTVSAAGAIAVSLNGEGPAAVHDETVFPIEATGAPMWLSLTIETGQKTTPPTIRVTAKGASGQAQSLAREQLLLPWTPVLPPPPPPLENVPDLSGGDPRKGAIVFASGDARCANCHRVRGEGGTVGPDLSGLVGRDRKEVYRDIAEPSAQIQPDFLPYTVALKDGRILVGTVRAEGADAIRLADTEAKVTVVPRAEIEEFRPGATSVMPVGLAGAIGEERLRDLIAFLTTPPGK